VVADTAVPQATLAFRQVPGSFAVCRLVPGAQLPDWFKPGAFASVSWSSDEVSITCLSSQVPDGVHCEREWCCLMLQGPFPFEMTGILLQVLKPLAAAGIGIFAVSTFDTDYVLVKEQAFEAAKRALIDSGLRFIEECVS
jgi:hypothetical protein